ncbi:hypothetical protein DFH09DRAFT_1424108 [Mycena vulgaris]|nr:hypothetical protein DFH09DRAFT_1424108 [Mycena vulgaris]
MHAVSNIIGKKKELHAVTSPEHLWAVSTPFGLREARKERVEHRTYRALPPRLCSFLLALPFPSCTLTIPFGDLNFAPRSTTATSDYAEIQRLKDSALPPDTTDAHKPVGVFLPRWADVQGRWRRGEEGAGAEEESGSCSRRACGRAGRCAGRRKRGAGVEVEVEVEGLMLEARARADGQMGRVEVRWGVGDMCATQKRWDTVVIGGARVSEKGALVSGGRWVRGDGEGADERTRRADARARQWRSVRVRGGRVAGRMVGDVSRCLRADSLPQCRRCILRARRLAGGADDGRGVLDVDARRLSSSPDPALNLRGMRARWRCLRREEEAADKRRQGGAQTHAGGGAVGAGESARRRLGVVVEGGREEEEEEEQTLGTTQGRRVRAAGRPASSVRAAAETVVRPGGRDVEGAARRRIIFPGVDIPRPRGRRARQRARATAPHRVGGGEKERRGSGADDAGATCTCGEACKSCGGGVGRSRRRRRVEHAEKASRRRAPPSPSSLRCPAGGGERAGVWDAATATRRREAADAAATRGCRFTCHPRGAARWGVDACRCAFLADGWGEDKRRGVGENASSSAGRSFFVSSKAGGGRRAGEALMCGGEYEGSGVHAGGRRQRRVDSPCMLTCRWLEGAMSVVMHAESSRPPSSPAVGFAERREEWRGDIRSRRMNVRAAEARNLARMCLKLGAFWGVGTLDGVRAGAEDASSACIGGCPRLQLALHDVYGLEGGVCAVRGARVVLSPLRARGGERHVSAAGRAGAGLRPLP